MLFFKKRGVQFEKLFLKFSIHSFLCIFPLFFCTGCAEEKEAQALLKELKKKEYAITIGEVTQQDVPHYLMAVGQLQASVTVNVKPQVNGILTAVLFQDGQWVDEGDLLMVVDPRTYEADLKSAQATLEEDQARLVYSIQFETAYGAVVGNEYVSRLDYEEGVQNVGIYTAAVESDKAQIDIARVNLEYTEMRAPTQGYVGLRAADPGNYVNTAENQTLVTLLKVTPLFLNFSIPQAFVQQIREAQQNGSIYVEGILPSEANDPLKGSLTFIDNTVDNESGMIQLQATIPNEDERGWPGQFVRARLLLEMVRNAIVVPASAVVLSQDGQIVFVVQDDMTVQPVKVTKAFEYDGQIVVSSGVKPGQKVVTDGQLNLYPGAKVFVPSQNQSPAPSNEPKEKKT